MYQYKLNEQEINNLNLVISNEVREDIETISSYFIKQGFELYLVGGCVRDILLHKKPHDYDLCTNATPQQVKDILKETRFKTWDSGIKHGTLTITSHHDRESFEVTTYRNDGDYEDHRHPTNVTFSSNLEDDLKRRDFTINSFALSLNDLSVMMLDKSYLDDLKFGIIRCVGNPDERLYEDALRILRAFRFSAQLGFTIESKTLEAIIKHKEDLKIISKERIRDEINKIILSDNPTTLYWLAKYNIPIGIFIEELSLKHLGYIPKDLELRWSWLIINSNISDDFYNIEKFLKETAKMDTHTSTNILKVVSVLSNILNNTIFINKYSIKKIIANLGLELFGRCLPLFMHVLDDYSVFAKVKEIYDDVIKNNEPLYIKDLLINGNDIVNDGFLQGEEIGECLDWMLDVVLEDYTQNIKDRLLELLEEYKEMSFQNS